VEVDRKNDRLTVGTAALRLPHGYYTKEDIKAVIAGKAAELRVAERRRALLGELPAGVVNRRRGASDRRRESIPKQAVGVATQQFLDAEVNRFRAALTVLRRQRERAKTKS
jgi:hypothetical protein